MVPLPERPALVDASQLEQVLINLLKNAVESGSPAEEIAVGVDETDAAGAPVHALRVVDRGAGMDEETLQKALLPFCTPRSPPGAASAWRSPPDRLRARRTDHPPEPPGRRARGGLLAAPLSGVVASRAGKSPAMRRAMVPKMTAWTGRRAHQ